MRAKGRGLSSGEEKQVWEAAPDPGEDLCSLIDSLDPPAFLIPLPEQRSRSQFEPPFFPPPSSFLSSDEPIRQVSVAKSKVALPLTGTILQIVL